MLDRDIAAFDPHAHPPRKEAQVAMKEFRRTEDEEKLCRMFESSARAFNGPLALLEDVTNAFRDTVERRNATDGWYRGAARRGRPIRGTTRRTSC